MRAAQEVMACRANMLKKFEKGSVIGAPRRSRWRVAPGSWKIGSGK
ncbi:hypothetical protein A2U01_0119637, partial [Trifolium medium]|nr:hypothetical protein [Trifolium medium]